MTRLHAALLIVLMTINPVVAVAGPAFWTSKSVDTGTGGVISGTGASPQVAFFTGTQTIGGNANFTFNTAPTPDVMTLNGQAVVTGDPAGTATNQASIYVNPTAAPSGSFLLAMESNATRRFTYEQDGDVVWGNDVVSTGVGLWYNATLGRLGLGQTPQSQRFEIASQGSPGARLVGYSNTTTINGQIQLGHADGAAISSPTGVATPGTSIGQYRLGGLPTSGSQTYASGAEIKGFTTEAWSTTALGSRMHLTTVANTTTTQVDRIIIDQNGNVDIGTDTTPDFGLEVETTFGVNGNVTIGDAAADTITFNAAAWTLVSDTAVTCSGGVNCLNVGNDTISVDSSNIRFGVGTAAPDDELHVSKNQNGDTAVHCSNTTTGSVAGCSLYATGDGSGYANMGRVNTGYTLIGGSELVTTADTAVFSGNGAAGVFLLSANAAGILLFGTGGMASSNERMRITAAGNVGIGDTSPAALLTVGTGDLFQVDSSGRVQLPAGASGAGNLAVAFTADTNTGFYRSAAEEIMYQTNGADQLSIGQSFMQLETATATTPTCAADGDVGKFTKYTKAAGATISVCLCTKAATVYTLTALGAGDCT